jgi:hypothetical protein
MDMLRLFSLAMIFGIVLHITPAQAASSDGKYAIKGVGLASCKLYAEEKKKLSNRYFQFVGWMVGYMSGHNRYAKDVTDIAPWQTTDLLAAWVGTYCKSNPKALLVAATNRLIAALHANRLRSGSPRVKAEVGGKTVVIYEAILRRAQQMLSERGYYSAAADGKYGPATQKAIRKFQKEKKIAVTGLPDQRTLLLIFR